MVEGFPDPTGINTELVLKPVIKELVRTQVCFPNLKLLVDRISVITSATNGQSIGSQSYRLHLTDGEKAIQAVLKRKIHTHISSFDVREGSYVILKDYGLARGKKLSGNGSVIYVVIDDFYSIGEDNRDEVDEIRHDRYAELIKTPQRQQSRLVDKSHGKTQRRIFDSLTDKGHMETRDDNVIDDASYDSTPSSVRFYSPKIDSPSASLGKSPHAFKFAPSLEHKGKQRDKPFHEMDPNLTPRPTKLAKLSNGMRSIDDGAMGSPNRSGPPRSTGVENPTTAKQVISYDEREQLYSKPLWKISRDDTIHGLASGPRQGTTDIASMISPRNRGTSRTPVPGPSNHDDPQLRGKFLGHHRQQTLLPISRPLCIRSLESVSGRHAIRNKVYDFFAVICFVEAQVVKPAMMPPKRDIRIMDPSIDKKVLVSIFVDPLKFKPAVGTIALFRSLTTHEWDRGMLNAYPQHCGGKNWFIVDPVGVEGCNVEKLREWWKKKSAEMEQEQKDPG